MSVIHESAENYLESILMLSKKLPVVQEGTVITGHRNLPNKKNM